MKSTNHVSEILKNKGFEPTNNRNYFTKALNKVISDGFISFEIQDKGKIWLGDSGTHEGKFNLIVRGYGRRSRIYLREINSRNILQCVGNFVMNPNVAEKHIATITTGCNEIEPCAKCNGKGIIPLFSYYCGGLCFDCYGSKYMIVKRLITV